MGVILPDEALVHLQSAGLADAGTSGMGQASQRPALLCMRLLQHSCKHACELMQRTPDDWCSLKHRSTCAETTSHKSTEQEKKLTLVLCASLPGTKFLLLWHSSKMRGPSKSGPPTQDTTWSSLLEPFTCETSVE